MAIKVFDGTDNTFSTNGEIVLNPTRAIVHKEDNGSFYLDLEAPLTQETKYVAPEEGSSATINGSGQIQNVDSTKESELVSLKGDTYQYTTTGKNISNFEYKTQNGITWDGNEISVLNPTSYSYINDNWNLKDDTSKGGATYTIYTILNGVNNGSQYVSMNLGKTGNAYAYQVKVEPNITYTNQIKVGQVVLNQGETFTNINIYTSQSVNANFNIKLMIVKGAYTTETIGDYEPYTNGASPNPTYPQNINVVSGDNTIDICGKNLFDKDNANIINAKYSNGVITADNNERMVYIKCEPNTTYAFSKLVSRPMRNSIGTTQTLPAIGVAMEDAVYSATSPKTITTNANAKYIVWQFYALNDTQHTQQQMLDSMQIENGSATTYEPYKSQSYNVNLGSLELCKIGTYQDKIFKGKGVNLFNPNDLLIGYNLIGTSGETYVASDRNTLDYTQLKSNETYTISGIVLKNVCFYTDSKTFISNTQNTTFTMPQNAKYVRISFDNTQSFSQAQLEKGSQTTYEPYNAKDKWLLHKEIGKVVLNGVEGNWTLASSTSDYYEYQNYNVLTISSPSGYTFPLSNYFSDTTNNRVVANGKTLLIRVLASAGITTANDFKTWLSTHNTIVYYVLANPTTTEIDNSELVSELNAIELIGGLNNISLSSEYLTGPMEIKYNFVSGGETTAKYIDYLQANNILVANTPQGNQAFRIANVERTRSKIRLKANHIFYDSQNYVISDSYVVEKNCNQALDHLNDATDNESPFTMTSDITALNSYRCVRKSLYEAIQVVLERWGGHLVRDNFDIKVMNSIGNDNGVVVRYGKNLKNISATYNWDAVATKLMPVGKDGLLLPEEYLYASVQYDIPYTKVISFDQNNIVEDDYADADAYQQALINDLRQKGMEYLASNSIPMVNYTLNANLERITDIGDTIEVIDERLGINLLTNLIAYEYNCILDKYTQVQFGNFTPKLQNLMETIASNTEKAIEENNGVIQITLENELTEATDRIWGVLGNSYVIYEGDKILVVDELPKENAHNVIMINSGGIGFSQTGINGIFQSAWTIDNTLNMENINVINLTADLIKGGILKLGSNLNQYGQIEIYNEANTLIAELNKNGFKMYGTDGSYVLMNTQVGFAGYDRNDNKIYWADGDAFHMKKSEVEEEITLCGKMRYIPIHLTDTYGVEHNGIGLVSVLGGGN